MAYNAQNHWVSRLCPSSGILKTVKKKFWKLDLFRATGEGKVTCTLLGPLK
jgi:hypothetical protein